MRRRRLRQDAEPGKRIGAFESVQHAGRQRVGGARRIVAEAKALREIGIGTIAIMPNDTVTYHDDSFDNMKAFAAKHRFTFPYVIDETQKVARAYGAQCTPDFFGFNSKLELNYRGRLDASGREPAGPQVRRDLFEAMREIATTGQGPRSQIPSIGCSIKWKAA